MFTIGIDIGGTSISYAFVDEKGLILEKYEIETLAERGPEDVISRLVASLDKSLSGRKPESIGVGCAGMIDSRRGVVTFSNNIGWNNVPLASILSSHFGVEVFVLNDAIAATIGEAAYGTARGRKHVVMVTLGTGVGGGIIINGKVYLGAHGFAGILGHSILDRNGEPCSCGRRGCFELYGSASSLVRMAELKAKEMPESILSSYERINGRTFFEAVRKKDRTALEVFEEYTDNLALGFADIIDTLDPEIIVVSGGISNEGDFLLEPVRRKVVPLLYCKEAAMPEIKASSLSSAAGVLGASAAKKFLEI